MTINLSIDAKIALYGAFIVSVAVFLISINYVNPCYDEGQHCADQGMKALVHSFLGGWMYLLAYVILMVMFAKRKENENNTKKSS